MGVTGPVFGSNNYWKGLAIFLDSYDNDGKNNNPSVSIMINDGTRLYNHQSDGHEQVITGNFLFYWISIKHKITFNNKNLV